MSHNSQVALPQMRSAQEKLRGAGGCSPVPVWVLRAGVLSINHVDGGEAAPSSSHIAKGRCHGHNEVIAVTEERHVDQR